MRSIWIREVESIEFSIDIFSEREFMFFLNCNNFSFFSWNFYPDKFCSWNRRKDADISHLCCLANVIGILSNVSHLYSARRDKAISIECGSFLLMRKGKSNPEFLELIFDFLLKRIRNI